MKTFLILTLTALSLAGLAACSGGDQGNESVGADAAITDQSEKPAEMIPEAGAKASEDQNVELCRAAIQNLGGDLKSALQEAMEQGGPLAAVNVCHEEAAVIAQRICDEEGLIVGRTSGKFRSPANAPDEWEKAGLAAFTLRIAAGEKPKDLEMWATVTEADGNRSFRYLKAIPTAPLCLKCHGSELAPDLVQKLAELYPGDKATGFGVGDMRGAFTVKIDLPRS
jgi:hypothetical protein